MKKKTINPVIQYLDPDDLRKIGTALQGRHWQSDVAVGTGNSKSQITRFLKKERAPDYSFNQMLRGLMIDKIDNVSKLLSTKTLPGAQTGNTTKAQALINEALELLKAETKSSRASHTRAN